MVVKREERTRGNFHRAQDSKQSTRLFRLLNTGGRLTTEGIDTVFENVYNFLRLCHLLLQSSFSPPRKIGSETSKKVYWVRNVREDYRTKKMRFSSGNVHIIRNTIFRISRPPLPLCNKKTLQIPMFLQSFVSNL